MEPTPAVALNNIKRCSICLELYTRPKVLPCQHIFCYSCLINIANGQRRLTCPHCREEHPVPDSGVSGFRDSLVLNQLMSITFPCDSFCDDCKLEAVVSQCDHCGTSICHQCLVKHAKLSIEIKTSLKLVRQDLLSVDTGKQMRLKQKELEKNRKDLQEEHSRQLSVLNDQLKELKMTLERVSSLSNFVKSSIRIYDDLIATATGHLSSDSYISNLIRRIDVSNSFDSLMALRDEVEDFRTVSRIFQMNASSLTFSLDIRDQDLTKNASVRYGHAAVVVQGTYEQDTLIKRLNVASAASPCGSKALIEESRAHTLAHYTAMRLRDHEAAEESDVAPKKPESGGSESNAAGDASCGSRISEQLKPAEETDKAQASNNSPAEYEATTESPNLRNEVEAKSTKARRARRSKKRSRAKLMSFPETSPSMFQQNLLQPAAVDSTLSEDTLSMICIGQSDSDKYKLFQPIACAYNTGRDEIYVADNCNDRIVVYKNDGNESCIFARVHNPKDIAISLDGKIAHIATPTCVFTVRIETRKLCQITGLCHFGNFQDCRSVVCLHGTQLVVVERTYRCLLIFENGHEIHSFGWQYLKRPSMVAYNPVSELFYVTDLEFSCVKVFTLEGAYVTTFGNEVDDSNVSGIAVNEDDLVFVSRTVSQSIDIYNPRRQKQLVRTICNDGLLQSPYGLCMMPNGRLIVADMGKDYIFTLGSTVSPTTDSHDISGSNATSGQGTSFRTVGKSMKESADKMDVTKKRHPHEVVDDQPSEDVEQELYPDDVNYLESTVQKTRIDAKVAQGTTYDVVEEVKASEGKNYDKQVKPNQRRESGTFSLSQAQSMSFLQTPRSSAYHHSYPPRVDLSSIGENTVTVIGESEYLLEKHKLHQPKACAYNVTTDEIYVVDGTDRIVIYSGDGRQARNFFGVLKNIQDLTVSPDGVLLYLVRSTLIHVVKRATGRRVHQIDRCSLGYFKECGSALCTESMLVVLERRYRSLIFYNEKCQEIRLFGQEHLEQPMTAVYDPASELFFVTDLALSSVKVFGVDGSYVQTFAGLGHDNDVCGIAVDEDGYVFVSRILTNRIDIYNAQRQLIKTVSNDGQLLFPLQSPRGLCLMPNGSLIVVNSGKDHLVIL